MSGLNCTQKITSKSQFKKVNMTAEACRDWIARKSLQVNHIFKKVNMPWGYKTVIMLNSIEHEVSTAN